MLTFNVHHNMHKRRWRNASKKKNEIISVLRYIDIKKKKREREMKNLAKLRKLSFSRSTFLFCYLIRGKYMNTNVTLTNRKSDVTFQSLLLPAIKL